MRCQQSDVGDGADQPPRALPVPLHRDQRWPCLCCPTIPLPACPGVTLSAAEILGVQDKLGSLEVGKEANLVVLEENPLKVDKMKIKDIKISYRVFQGVKC